MKFENEVAGCVRLRDTTSSCQGLISQIEFTDLTSGYQVCFSFFNKIQALFSGIPMYCNILNKIPLFNYSSNMDFSINLVMGKLESSLALLFSTLHI